MCHNCWEQAGSPTDLPATYNRFAELHKMLDDIAPAGGPLHVVLDDWNLDRWIEPYPGQPYRDPYDGTVDNTEQVYTLCREIADLLNDMTEPQRYAALAKVKGYA